GSLIVEADGGVGSGNVVVESGSLILKDGETHNYLHDDSRLILQGTLSGLVLDFDGVDAVSAVSLDGGETWLEEGVYDAFKLNLIGSGVYHGNGSLHITSTPGPIAVPPSEDMIWDLTTLREHPVTMEVVSSKIVAGRLR